jgi:hypothetical protein
MANNSLTFQQNRRKNIAAFLNFLTLKQGTFFFRARGSIRGFGNNPKPTVTLIPYKSSKTKS